jgi:ABC-type bacteriocin/lantibiotic exporter with double-glycine peptidase domain
MDNKDFGKKIVDNKTIKGKIEFRNVWFRYPTRK